MVRLAAPLVALSVLMLACDQPPREGDPQAEVDTAAVDRTDEPGAAAAPGAPVCLQGGPFVADGGVEVGSPATAGAGGGMDAGTGAPRDRENRDREGRADPAAAPTDAHAISALRWEPHEGCERLVLDLVDAGGGPAARPGGVRAEVLRDLGVVRVTLDDVERVAPEATDATFDGSLVGAAFAVFGPEGRRVYVDVHVRNPAEASVLTLRDPARVVVDLRPGGGAVPEPASRGQQVVVLAPRPGEAAYPLVVTGYARTFEANVVVRLERDGTDVHQDFTTATAWAAAWGHYTFTIERGPAGSVMLHVGDHSARDGTWQGVAVPLEMR